VIKFSDQSRLFEVLQWKNRHRPEYFLYWRRWRERTGEKGSSHVKTTADIIIKTPLPDKWIGSDESLPGPP
jgi:hypothetical protein